MKKNKKTKQRKLCANDRRLHGLTMQQCIDKAGIVIDSAASLEITSYCWCNDMDLSLLSYGMVDEYEESGYHEWEEEEY